MGLCRDDALGVQKDAPGHDADPVRKRIMGILKWYGLKITIQTNQNTTNFLGTSFNLGTGRYRPSETQRLSIMYRIRGNFRTSNFRITTKWNILNGFIFKLPAHPPREKLRCPDTLKYMCVLCRVNG